MPPERGGKREDIEGIRAIAVLLVLLWHAGLKQLPGGFVGVDVFFVVSGFLMTMILHREMASSRRHRISVLGFYARRARRLIPASTFTLAATAVAAWLILPVTRLWETGLDIISAGIYVVNWRLAERAVDYLAQDSAPSPVQHFWSLSVEEQYYLLWPLIIVSVGWLVYKTHRSPRVWVAVTLSVIFVASLARSVLETATDPGRAYFVTTTRVWELSLGGLVAVTAIYFDRVPKAIAAAAAWAGVVAIMGTGLFLTTDVPFPGSIALVPTVATAVVLAFGPAAGAAGPVRIFSIGKRPSSTEKLPYGQPFQLIGGLSYSLYLWHWPFLVIGGYAITDGLREITLTEGLLLVALSVIPAWVSYRFVERPFRDLEFFKESIRNSLGIALTGILIVTISASLIMTNIEARPYDGAYSGTAIGAQPTAPGQEVTPFGAMVLGDDPRNSPAGHAVPSVDLISPDPAHGANDTPPVYADKCSLNETQSDATGCKYGSPDAKFTVALVGDSHAAHWVKALQYVAQKRDWRLQTYTKSACPFIEGTIRARDGLPYTSCTQRNDQVRALLTGPDKPNLVVVASSDYYTVLSGGSLPDALAAGWKSMTDAGIPVVALTDTPISKFVVPECVTTHRDSLQDCATPRNVAIKDQGQAQREAAKFVPAVKLIDLNDWICPSDPCPAVIGNTLVYFDTNHLSGTYSSSLGPQLDKAIGPR